MERLFKKPETSTQGLGLNGKDSYQFWDECKQDVGYERLELETDLRKALERNEFQLYYQPKINLNSGKIKGVEALIRWFHPEKGLIPPDKFIPLAEETGLIVQIGEWVLRTACKQAIIWQDTAIAPFEMSVNMSVRQLYQPNLVEMVREVLEETGLNSKYLEIEITESVMADSEHILKVLHELKQLGLKISLDDFGTGFSSLHYLKEAPFDTLKIDQSFVRNCTNDENDAVIVKTVIAMAHQLKLEVVAEGVEKVEQLIFLQKNLCDIGQGYLFSKPLPTKEFVNKIEELEQIVGKNGIPKDLKNQKYLDEDLKIARQELLDTLRLQPGMTFKFINENGRFIHTFCNGKLLYKIGLVPEQIIGRELKDFQPVEEAKRITQYYRRAWEGENHVTYEVEFNGGAYLATLRPVKRRGEVIEVIASCVDITERRKFEKAPRQSELNDRHIADNMSDLIEVWDADGNVQYFSPSHERIFGHSYQSYVGRSVFSLIHPEDKEYVKTQFRNMISKNSLFQAGFRCKNVSGEWIYIEAQGTPVVGKSGNVEQIVVGCDISEKKD